MSEHIPKAAEIQAKEADRAAQEVLTVAKTVVVTNDEQYQVAGARFAEIKANLKSLEAQRVAITGPMNAALTAVNALFKRPKEALEYALSLYEKPMGAFQREQIQKRREAEEAARRETERLRREAQEREEAERRRLADLQREADEAKRLASQAASPVAAFIANQRAAEAAVEVEAQSTVVMDAIREKVTVTAPVEYVPKASAAGTSVRTNWKFEITDPDAIPREYLIPDEKKIGEFARTMKEKASLPGVRFFDEIKIGGR